jgi:hypothetical protein
MTFGFGFKSGGECETCRRFLKDNGTNTKCLTKPYSFKTHFYHEKTFSH